MLFAVLVETIEEALSVLSIEGFPADILLNIGLLAAGEVASS